MWAWGNNNTGQLGDGAVCGKTCTTPVQASGLADTAAIAGGYVHSLAATTAGTAHGWGRNAEGQLGDGTTTTRTTPVQVAGLGGVQPAPGVQATYTYDGDGLRTARTVNGTTTSFTWDHASGLPLLLTDGTNS